MGFFDFLRPKKKLPKAKIEVTASEPTKEELDRQYKEYYQQQRQEQMRTQAEAAIKRYSELHNPILKDDAGLLPTEILMLSYYQKYSKGTNVAKFWYYDYGITDVWPIIRRLESLGFAKDGKLTDSGKQEIKNNEYVYFWHRKGYAKFAYRLPEYAVAVKQHQDKQYKDLLWGRYNEMLAGNLLNSRMCHNIHLCMFQFLKDEKRYDEAFRHLLFAPYYDMNEFSPYINGSIIADLKDLRQRIDLTENEVFEIAKNIYKNVAYALKAERASMDDRSPHKRIVNYVDAAGLVTACIFAKDGAAQRVAKKYQIDLQ
nr:MAG TPA: hypothetical protein [Caudoviricetes sp.]